MQTSIRTYNFVCEILYKNVTIKWDSFYQLLTVGVIPVLYRKYLRLLGILYFEVQIILTSLVPSHAFLKVFCSPSSICFSNRLRSACPWIGTSITFI